MGLVKVPWTETHKSDMEKLNMYERIARRSKQGGESWT